MRYLILFIFCFTISLQISLASEEKEETSAFAKLQESQNKEMYHHKLTNKKIELEIDKMRLKEKSRNEARLGQ